MVGLKLEGLRRQLISNTSVILHDVSYRFLDLRKEGQKQSAGENECTQERQQGNRNVCTIETFAGFTVHLILLSWSN
jgi:hypothetical protein